MFQNVMSTFNGKNGQKNTKLEGTVVLMKKNALDFNDFNPAEILLDGLNDFLGQQVSIQLISAVNGKLGNPSYLDNWMMASLPIVSLGESAFRVSFDWDENEHGSPGAFLIKNNRDVEFYLKSLTLDHVSGHGRMHFICNSWVYPARCYSKDRIFFSNKTYLPHETPKPLRKHREEELMVLRGNGVGELKEWDRVYDYACYNDLGDPDLSPAFARQVLGGSDGCPYPRRGRTSRPPTKTDPNSESRLPLLMSLDIYVPRDEKFGHLKMSDFVGYTLKSIAQFLIPALEAIFGENEFNSFEDILKLYKEGIKLPGGPIFDLLKQSVPIEIVREIFGSDGVGLLKYPMPDIIKESKSAWRTDEEFAREMLAGVHPLMIRRLEEFPPKSKLDKRQYGDQNSCITEDHIRNNLDGLTVQEALKKSKFFILDHHDALMPYIRRINSLNGRKMYATRTLLFLKSDGTLKPIAIELSLPNPEGDQYGAMSKVYTPYSVGVQANIWQLAKAYVAVNDSGLHQLISHWLQTHAVIEPFVIAANRQLSVLHPIHKLLQPHFRDTMNINAFARQVLVNSNGIIELTVFPGKYAMEMSSVIYKNWVFTEQALPQDLFKRGVAVKDSNSPHGLRLLIEDYPYAVDGLEIWSAIKKWVNDYCCCYYQNDEMIRADNELQAWWKEVREVGHGDKKDESWWPKMQTREDLIESCTIIIWIASALHAAVNFGQYPYGGYMPNRPMISRRFMPEEGTPEYKELESNPDKAFLKTMTTQLQTLVGMSLIEILSKHTSDEVYLGKRDTDEWTTDEGPLKAFNEFGKKLEQIEEKIKEMNNNAKFKNRAGPVELPYTLLFPSSGEGLTGKGIPNSVSI